MFSMRNVLAKGKAIDTYRIPRSGAAPPIVRGGKKRSGRGMVHEGVHAVVSYRITLRIRKGCDANADGMGGG